MDSQKSIQWYVYGGSWEMKARSGFGKINGIPHPSASLNLEIASQVQSSVIVNYH